MRQKRQLRISLFAIAAAAIFIATPHDAAAHCDTLDGPVIQDARKAIGAKEITPVLKWVKAKDEKAVRAAFQNLLAAKAASREEAESAFFVTLVKIHRAGEGAPFTGLKPAGTVEPAIAEADKALESGSADALVQLISADVAAGIKERYQRAAEAYKHKDESVAQGREFVDAYVAYTHYVERLHQDATGKGSHDEHAEHGKVEKRHHKHEGKVHHLKH